MIDSVTVTSEWQIFPMKTNLQQSPSQPKARMRIGFRMGDCGNDGFITYFQLGVFDIHSIEA